MRIAETHTHLGGLEFLLVRQKQIWNEIQDVIRNVCSFNFAGESTTGNTGKRPAPVVRRFDRLAIINGFRKQFEERNWITRDLLYEMSADKDDSLGESRVERPIRSDVQSDFIKDRIAVEIQFGKHSLSAYDLFVKHLAFYVGDRIDVGVEILPMKSMQARISSGVCYYEGEVYNVVRQGRGVPAVPLVVVGVDV